MTSWSSRLAKHGDGDESFEDEFDAPSLGPVFDNVSCEGCHLGDGRGKPPYEGEQFESMLFRSSIPGCVLIQGSGGFRS